MNIKVRGSSADQILAFMAETEQRLPDAPGKTAPHIFRKMGCWLIQEAYLTQLILHRRLWRSPTQIPGLWLQPFPRGLFALLWARLAGPRVSSQSSAQAICVKSSARAIYLGGRPYTTKVYREKAGRREQDLICEVETRLKLEAWACVNLPVLLHYELERYPPSLTEEIVWGRRCHRGDAGRICTNLLPQLARMYQRHGIVCRPLDQIIEPDRWLVHISKAMELVNWDSSWIRPTVFLNEVSELLIGGGHIPCSLGHGDLALSNLVLTPTGEIYVLDWEKARERPIVFDLHKLMRRVPALRAAVRTLLPQLLSREDSHSVMAFDRQCLLSALSRINKIMSAGDSSRTRSKPGRSQLHLQDWFAEANSAATAASANG